MSYPQCAADGCSKESDGLLTIDRRSTFGRVQELTVCGDHGDRVAGGEGFKLGRSSMGAPALTVGGRSSDASDKATFQRFRDR